MMEVIGSSVTIAKAMRSIILDMVMGRTQTLPDAFLVNLKDFGYAVCENVAYLLFSGRSMAYDWLNSLAVL